MPNSVDLFLKVISQERIGAAHGLRDIPIEDRISHLELLISLLAELVQSDPLCLNYKNLILSPKEVIEELEKTWLGVNDQNRTTLAGSYLAGWTWVRALYYKTFVDLGLEVHGPYEADEKFGKGAKLIIRDFHDIQNIPAWEISRRVPFKRIRISQIYQGVDLKITFLNHLLPATNLGSHLVHYRMEADNQIITEIKKIETINEKLAQLANQQITAVNRLKPIEQVEKAAETSAYSLRKIYEAGGKENKGQEYVRKNFKTFGEKFLKELSSAKHQHSEYIKNIYDPRNNLLGADLLTI